MGIRHEQTRVADTGTCPFSLSTARIAFSILGVLPLTKLGGLKIAEQTALYSTVSTVSQNVHKSHYALHQLEIEI